MTDISPGQQLTRRRAMGRRLSRKATELSVLCGDINGSDLQFLTAKEKTRLDKLVSQLQAVGKHLNTMGETMDQP